MKLEICANSFESGLAAQQAGAHRIELCQELALGGITPSHGLLTKVVEQLKIPVYVLIRPRSGDFTYSPDEFDVMLRDIAFAKTLGCTGIVSGVLHPDLTIDRARTAQLQTASDGMDFTFHRAFDWTPDALAALQTLETLGVPRVLTSGQATSAVDGFELLCELQQSAQSISIMPGGGIDAHNVKRFKEAGFMEVHGSASHFRESVAHHLPMHNCTSLDAHTLRYSDVAKITELLVKIK